MGRRPGPVVEVVRTEAIEVNGWRGQVVAGKGRRGTFLERIVLAVRGRRIAQDEEAALALTYVDKATLLKESDFVSLHVPLTPDHGAQVFPHRGPKGGPRSDPWRSTCSS